MKFLTCTQGGVKEALNLCLFYNSELTFCFPFSGKLYYTFCENSGILYSDSELRYAHVASYISTSNAKKASLSFYGTLKKLPDYVLCAVFLVRIQQAKSDGNLFGSENCMIRDRIIERHF